MMKPPKRSLLHHYLKAYSDRTSRQASSKSKKQKTVTSCLTSTNSKDCGVFLTEAKSSSHNILQKLISECSSLQESLNTLKVKAVDVLSNSYSKLRQDDQHSSPNRFYESKVYRKGKALLAAKTKVQTENCEQEHLKLVKSLMLVKDTARPSNGQKLPSPKQFVTIKDLKTKKTSQLLAINRRKFGESVPLTLRLVEDKPIKPKLQLRGNLEDSLMRDVHKYNRNKTDLSFIAPSSRSPPKSRQVLANEQEQLFEQMEQMTPLNQLIISRSQKYRPKCSSQLNVRRNLEMARKYEMVKPSPEVLRRARSITRARQRDTSRDRQQLSKTVQNQTLDGRRCKSALGVRLAAFAL